METSYRPTASRRKEVIFAMQEAPASQSFSERFAAGVVLSNAVTNRQTHERNFTPGGQRALRPHHPTTRPGRRRPGTDRAAAAGEPVRAWALPAHRRAGAGQDAHRADAGGDSAPELQDRKSTRLNSSHL